MTETLRLARTHFPVTALGYGARLGIWVQGCPLGCPGCIAKDTWEAAGGTEVDVDELLDEVRQAVSTGADGLTVSGGEPLEQAPALTTFLQRVRTLDAEQFDILLYTGFEVAELDPVRRDAANLADVVITGRYRATAPTGLIWRGSTNQEMHLLTALARQRYTSYVDYKPDTPPIQITTTRDGYAWWAGVPNHPDTKRVVEASLHAAGYEIESTSWRRPPRGDSSGD